MNISELIISSIEASYLAGEEILRVYKKDNFSISIKADKSPLTEADLKSNDTIKKAISKFSIPILSEEGKNIDYESRKNWEHFWLIDPLDGTKEFINRNDEFTVNIALIKNSIPVFGVVYVPVLRELYYSIPEKGAFKISDFSTNHFYTKSIDELIFNSQKLPFHQNKDEIVVVASRSHLSVETKNYIDTLKSRFSKIKTKSRGSALKLCLIAEGSADIYPRFAPTMEWDTGAGHAIINSAGFKIINYETKKELCYNKENLVNPWFIAIGNVNI